jgi:pimeloyl-ACP methyl ester carboxylesterase
LVIWGLGDTALLPGLIEGLDDYIPDLTLRTVPAATHWIVHEQPKQVAQWLQEFLQAR